MYKELDVFVCPVGRAATQTKRGGAWGETPTLRPCDMAEGLRWADRGTTRCKSYHLEGWEAPSPGPRMAALPKRRAVPFQAPRNTGE
jgi:hypothetical protein